MGRLQTASSGSYWPEADPQAYRQLYLQQDSTDMNAELFNMKTRPQNIRAALGAACILVANAGHAGVPLYDFAHRTRDDIILVGMECNHKSKSLQIGIFGGDNPPTEHMALWKTSDLVTYDVQTNMVSTIKHVERNCTLGNARYDVRIEGLPGAMNAMWMCGAVITAKVNVLKNGQLIYEQELSRCNVERSVRLARFSPASDMPTLIREDN
jgi:hypothetical protein